MQAKLAALEAQLQEMKAAKEGGGDIDKQALELALMEMRLQLDAKESQLTQEQGMRRQLEEALLMQGEGPEVTVPGQQRGSSMHQGSCCPLTACSSTRGCQSWSIKQTPCTLLCAME
jgi:hypothetical protein